jgi:hypothetical protein
MWRILRLNPNLKQGTRLRGWHPTQTAKQNAAWHGWVSKGAFIREHGRETWEAIPNGAKIKEGRRQYVSREFMDDHLWLVYTGAAKPCVYAVFLTRRYSNDPRGCPIEYVESPRLLPIFERAA